MKEDLSISETVLPGCVVELTVVVPQKQVAKAWSQSIKYFAKNLVMEGFRKGKKACPVPPAAFWFCGSVCESKRGNWSL